jgi:predicted O-methyltransferase YrrM
MQPAQMRQPTLIDDGGIIVRARDIELHLWEGTRQVPASDTHRIYLLKDRRFLTALADMLDRVTPAPTRIIEIGAFAGGSAIYWAERYAVERLTAFEMAPAAPFLTQYIERHGLTDSLRVHFETRQEDVAALMQAVDQDFAGQAVDAVIDDASHQYKETRTSLETLLPFVRNGGVYVIEDWAWGHHKNWRTEWWAEAPLMSPLLSELMLICGTGRGVIDRIEIDPNFAAIWRGHVPLPTDGSFRLTDHYVARGFRAALPPEPGGI